MTADSGQSDAANEHSSTDTKQDGKELPQWGWRDRWTGKILVGDDYPGIWDEMKTEEYKPTIVSWEIPPELADTARTGMDQEGGSR